MVRVVTKVELVDMADISVHMADKLVDMVYHVI